MALLSPSRGTRQRLKEKYPSQDNSVFLLSLTAPVPWACSPDGCGFCTWCNLPPQGSIVEKNSGLTILRDSCQFILKGPNVKGAPKHNFRASWRWDTLLWYFSSSLKRVCKEMSLATPIATGYLLAPYTWALVPLCHLDVYGLCTSTTHLCVQAPGNPKPLKMWSKAPKPQDFFPHHGNSPITLTRRTSLTISVWEWQLSTVHWYSTSFVGLSLNTAGSFEFMSRLSKMLFAFKRW